MKRQGEYADFHLPLLQKVTSCVIAYYSFVM